MTNFLDGIPENTRKRCFRLLYEEDCQRNLTSFFDGTQLVFQCMALVMNRSCVMGREDARPGAKIRYQGTSHKVTRTNTLQREVFLYNCTTSFQIYLHKLSEPVNLH